MLITEIAAAPASSFVSPHLAPCMLITEIAVPCMLIAEIAAAPASSFVFP